MKTTITVLSLLATITAAPAFAMHHGESLTFEGDTMQVAVGSHTVSGHYRSNGTYVQSYRRTNPDGYCGNNYGGC